LKSVHEPAGPCEFDLREAGLLPVNKGDVLRVIQVYMGPRILVQNQHGEYGLVRAEDVAEIQTERKKKHNSGASGRRRCQIM
uniref:FeoA domain-containing protein n=1 Tax=Echinostoma caproni TaxID=27848 RepID=A0A183APC4_9TREM